ncbi:MAG: 16S rRNA (adenine(1518)-N(6)/adenine(1519)-N(6))-dimethyltransferase RsmA [Ruminococcaceae bacterium]|nr:16S rRNA (adenine(1518)-N(6)/adenine(1519)-N(6))-dimethyltransferase RsmA [Oscillospiraceae bacterium]
MNLYTPTGIAELMNEFGFSFSKKYGQNFLINEAVVQKIADSSFESAKGEKKACLEIGPGIGSLTSKLAQKYDLVRSVEIDDRLIPILAKTLAPYENTAVINSDFLQVDLKKLFEEQFSGYSVSVCANLPYYITSQIIMQLLESGCRFDSLVLMVQKEAAQRLISSPGKAEYGSIAAAVSYYAKASKLFDVQAGSFMPRPNVTSSVLRLVPYETKPVTPKNEELFLKMIRAAFSQRRKTLLNSLNSFFSSEYSKDRLEAFIAAAGIDPQRRGETLTLAELKALSDAFE